MVNAESRQEELRKAWHEADAITDSDLAAFGARGASIGRKQARLTRAVALLDDPDASGGALAELRALRAEQAALARAPEALADRVAQRVSHNRCGCTDGGPSRATS
jgi:hypothetical protein